MRVAGTSYGGLLLSVIVLVLLLNFLVPSGMAQLAILAPMVMGMVKAFGVDKGSRIGRGLFVILTYSCGLFNKMILAGGATVLARGLVERITGQAIPWSQYFIAYVPAILVTVAASWLAVMWLYPPERRRIALRTRMYGSARATVLEHGRAENRDRAWARRLLLWATDFAHHIDPAVIALGAGLAVALPGIGVLTTKDIRGVNFLLTVFLGAALSMGTVLIQTKGAERADRRHGVVDDALSRRNPAGAERALLGGILLPLPAGQRIVDAQHVAAGDDRVRAGAWAQSRWRWRWCWPSRRAESCSCTNHPCWCRDCPMAISTAATC